MTSHAFDGVCARLNECVESFDYVASAHASSSSVSAAAAAFADNSVMSTYDAEYVRWCEPYSEEILRHHTENEQKTPSSDFISEQNRRTVVNWMCNVVRHCQYRSETFWIAVAIFDRYVASPSISLSRHEEECSGSGSNGSKRENNNTSSGSSSSSTSTTVFERKKQTESSMQKLTTATARTCDYRLSEDAVQCIAAAAIQLAASFQETALTPSLIDLATMCGNRYTPHQLRTSCWRITAALKADLYWPTPAQFYRHYSRAMRQTTLEHTMSKFVVETIAFARDFLLCAFVPSMLAACALFIAQWCAYDRFPSTEWVNEWRNACFFISEARDDERKQQEIKLCTQSLAIWIYEVLQCRDQQENLQESESRRREVVKEQPGGQKISEGNGSTIESNGSTLVPDDISSVLRRFSHRELFSVARLARLPRDAPQLIEVLLFAPPPVFSLPPPPPQLTIERHPKNAIKLRL